jgi:hypothetical protein
MLLGVVLRCSALLVAWAYSTDSAWAIYTRMRFTGPFHISSCPPANPSQLVTTNIRYDLDFRPLQNAGSIDPVATILLYTQTPHSSCAADPLGTNCLASFPADQRTFLPNPREIPISISSAMGGQTFHLLAVGFSMASGSLQITHTRVTPFRFLECTSSPAPLASPGAGFGATLPVTSIVPGTPTFLQNQTTVAHWALEIQRDRLSQAREIGVMADNASGIQRVDFSVNGGPIVSVSQRRYGKRDAAPGYFITVDPAQFSPGTPIEIRAVVYPVFGKTAVLAGPWTTLPSGSNPPSSNTGLASLFLYADPNNALPRATVYLSPNGNDTNGNGTVSAPFLTFARAVNSLRTSLGNVLSGGTIALLPGEYVFGSGTPNWWNLSEFTSGYLSVEAAPGVPSDQVRFIAPLSNWMARYLKVRNVTMLPPFGQSILRDGDGERKAHLYVENVDVYSPDNTSGHYNYGGNEFGFKAVKNSYTVGGDRGVDSATWVAFFSTYYGTGIAFNDSILVYSSVAENYDQYRRHPANHGDLFHIHGRGKNILMYWLLRGVDLFRIQGVFLSAAKDGVAIIESISDLASREKETGAPGNAAPIGGQQNMIIRNSEFLGQANVFTTPANQPGSVFLVDGVSFPLNPCNTFNEDCNTATGSPNLSSGVLYLAAPAPLQANQAVKTEKTVAKVKAVKIGKPAEISQKSLRTLLKSFPKEVARLIQKQTAISKPAVNRKLALRRLNNKAKSVVIR